MKQFWSPVVGGLTAGFAALCCLGIPFALSGLALIGLPFLSSDLFLVPLMVIALAVFLWGIHRSGCNKTKWIFAVSIVGAAFAFMGIWFSSFISIVGFVLMAVGFFLTLFARPKT